MRRPMVVIESPYAGDVARNEAYARGALLDSIKRGETPFAGHLLYPQVLDDNIESERAAGITMHCQFIDLCDYVVCYVDYGTTRGMQLAIGYANIAGKTVMFRRLYP